MTFTLTTKLAAATGLTAVILGGLVAPMAQADPIAASGKSIFGQLSGVGSDTLQDVDNGLQIAIGRVDASGLNTGDWKLASYDATGGDYIQTKSGGNAHIGRPNGSGDGRDALLTAIGQKTNTTGKTTFGGTTGIAWKNDSNDPTANDQVIGQIQYSRSSSGPGNSAVTTGVVSYVPFAKDAVDYAVAANSKFPALSLGADTDSANGSGVAPSTLFAIYKCEADAIVVSGGVGTKLAKKSVYTLGTGESFEDIHAYIPQSSSGTAKFWALKFYGAEGASLPSCVTRTYNSGASNVQEHDGSAIENVAGGIMPFSIPKWVGMAKNAASVAGFSGVTDVRHGAVLGTLNGVTPTNGAAATLVMNPTFLTNTTTSLLSRMIFHVVPYRLVTDPTTAEYTMFKGTTSLVCSHADVIRAYGFGVLTATTGASACGSTDASLRAYAASTPTVTATASLDNANSEVDFNVSSYVSNGKGGAKVYVIATNASDPSIQYIANTDAPALLDAGTESKTFSLPYSAIRDGQWNLGVQVVANLPGVANFTSNLNLATKTIIRTATTVTAVASGKIKKFGKLVVTVTGDGGTPTGTITVHKGTSAAGAVIATGSLTAGTVTITTLPKQKKKGKVKLFVEYSGDPTYQASTVAATWNVK